MVKKYILHISVLCAVFVFISSCNKSGKVIPRATMAKIYAEMFVSDQWINSDYKARRMADTTLVYGGIFDKYGYTVRDYRRSMEYYMDDPDRYARILKQSAIIIEGRIKDLKEEKDRLKTLSDSKAATDAFMPKRIFFLSGMSNKDLLKVDSLVFYIDSTGGSFEFDVQKGRDTIYYGPRFEVSDGDTVSVSGLAVKDSLAKSAPADEAVAGNGVVVLPVERSGRLGNDGGNLRRSPRRISSMTVEESRR